MLHRRLLNMLVVGLALGLALGLMTGCPNKKPKDATCTGDKDCKDGRHCVAKKCVQCGDASHCPDGQTCEMGACVAAKDACTSYEQCGDGQVCKDNACSACATNNDCGPGGTCGDGVCQRPKACVADENCADDEDCIDGRCLKPWKGEAPDALSCQLSTVIFGFDEDVIPTEQRELLNQTAECILQAPADRGVYVFGHADDVGTEEYNIALSERRARAIADYLARLGIDPARLNVVPKGESEPSGTQNDRRVEFEWR